MARRRAPRLRRVAPSGRQAGSDGSGRFQGRAGRARRPPAPCTKPCRRALVPRRAGVSLLEPETPAAPALRRALLARLARSAPAWVQLVRFVSARAPPPAMEQPPRPCAPEQQPAVRLWSSLFATAGSHSSPATAPI